MKTHELERYISDTIQEEMSDTEYYIAGAGIFKDALLDAAISLKLSKREIRSSIRFHTSNA